VALHSRQPRWMVGIFWRHGSKGRCSSLFPVPPFCLDEKPVFVGPLAHGVEQPVDGRAEWGEFVDRDGYDVLDVERCSSAPAVRSQSNRADCRGRIPIACVVGCPTVVMQIAGRLCPGRRSGDPRGDVLLADRQHRLPWPGNRLPTALATVIDPPPPSQHRSLP
jgi:hypothetical protein